MSQGLSLEQVELGQRCAGHDATRSLDEVHTRRLRREGNRARGTRVCFEHIDAVFDDRELHIDEPDHTERLREPAHDLTDGDILRRAEGRRGEHARGVPGMDARLLDVLHGHFLLYGLRDKVDHALQSQVLVEREISGDLLQVPSGRDKRVAV